MWPDWGVESATLMLQPSELPGQGLNAFTPVTLFSICVLGTVLFVSVKEWGKNMLSPEAHTTGLNNKSVTVAHSLQ